MGDIRKTISVDTGRTHAATAENLLAGVDLHFAQMQATGERFVLRLGDGSQIQAHQLGHGSISLFGGSTFTYTGKDGVRHDAFREEGNGVVLYKTTPENHKGQLHRARLIVMRAHRISQRLQQVLAP